MELDELYAYCSSKASATSGFPFDTNLMTFQIGGKIFAMIAIHLWEHGDKNIILKCTPELALELREQYLDITYGYTMNKQHWNSIYLRGSFSLAQIKDWIDLSYRLVYSGLSKKIQSNLSQLKL